MSTKQKSTKKAAKPKATKAKASNGEASKKVSAIDAAVKGDGRKWEDIAQEICQRFESALQIDDAPAWADRLERDRIYWETIARHAANLVEWCGDDSPISEIEAHMVGQMRGRIGSLN